MVYPCASASLPLRCRIKFQHGFFSMPAEINSYFLKRNTGTGMFCILIAYLTLLKIFSLSWKTQVASLCPFVGKGWGRRRRYHLFLKPTQMCPFQAFSQIILSRALLFLPGKRESDFAITTMVNQSDRHHFVSQEPETILAFGANWLAVLTIRKSPPTHYRTIYAE